MGPDFFPPLTNFINILSFYPQLIFRKALPFNLNLNSQPLISWSFQVALLSVVGQLLLSPNKCLCRTCYLQRPNSPKLALPQRRLPDSPTVMAAPRATQSDSPRSQIQSNHPPPRSQIQSNNPVPTASFSRTLNAQWEGIRSLLRYHETSATHNSLQPTTYYGIITHLQPANGNGVNND